MSLNASTRRKIAASAVLAATAASLLVSSPANALMPTLSVNTIVTGSDYGLTSGAPQISGVVLPNEDTMASLADDATVPTLALSVQTWNKMVVTPGGYALSIDPAAVPASYRDPLSGAVDIEITLNAGTTATTYDLTAYPSPAGSPRAWSDDPLVYNTPGASFVPGTETSPGWKVTDSAVATSSRWQEDGTADTTSSDVSVPTYTTSAVGNCHPIYTASSTTKPNLPEHVFNVYGWSGALGTAYQTTGTSHEMGIAGSAELTGVYKIEGSSSKTITSAYEKTVPRMTNKAVYNAITYRLYKGWDSCLVTHVLAYQWRPSGYFDVINSTFSHSITHVDFGYTANGSCVVDLPGTQIKKQSGTSLTFSTGITLTGVAKDVAGANLGVSTKSTWDHSGFIQYDITQKSMVCGSNSSGPAGAPQISASPPSAGGGCAVITPQDQSEGVVNPDVVQC